MPESAGRGPGAAADVTAPTEASPSTRIDSLFRLALRQRLVHPLFDAIRRYRLEALREQDKAAP